jgi:hypothetical protein
LVIGKKAKSQNWWWLRFHKKWGANYGSNM